MKQEAVLPSELTRILEDGLRETLPTSGRRKVMRERLLERVRRGTARRSDPKLVTVRASDGWEELAPKIFAKRVYTDGWAESYLVRLEPGCHGAPHEHPEDEECVVLEGELMIGDIRLRAGDFHVAHRGSSHGATTTETGALVMLRYAAPLSRYFPA